MKHTIAIAAAVLAVSATGAFASSIGTDTSLLAGPGTHYQSVAELTAGTNVTVIKENGSWCDVRTSTAHGWMPCRDVQGATKAAPAAPSYAKGYDFEADPFFGPTVPGGPHTIEHHSFS